MTRLSKLEPLFPQSITIKAFDIETRIVNNEQEKATFAVDTIQRITTHPYFSSSTENIKMKIKEIEALDKELEEVDAEEIIPNVKEEYLSDVLKVIEKKKDLIKADIRMRHTSALNSLRVLKDAESIYKKYTGSPESIELLKSSIIKKRVYDPEFNMVIREQTEPWADLEALKRLCTRLSINIKYSGNHSRETLSKNIKENGIPIVLECDKQHRNVWGI